MSTSVLWTMEVVVPKPPVQTLQVTSPVPVYLGTMEMDLRVKVSQIEIQILWHHSRCLDILKAHTWWLGGVVVSVLDLRPRGPRLNSRPVHRQAATLGKLLTPMCLCHQAVQFGTGQRAVMLCGREGNRRSGVALAMRRRSGEVDFFSAE